jgi:hypothetical protein
MLFSATGMSFIDLKIGNESWYIEKIGGGDGCGSPGTAPLT